MAEPSTVARPYAEAAFKLADDGASLDRWSEMLAALGLVARDERVRGAIGNPNLSDEQAAGVFIAVLAGKLSAEGENFVRVLAHNKRLELLPLIHEQFEALKNEREGVLEAELQSAFELTDAQVVELVRRLEAKTGRKVKARIEIAKDLIAGVRIVLGDKVIDGSVRAQLAALEAALKA
jgi:F-type H+-transporting ATPase subunit delta